MEEKEAVKKLCQELLEKMGIKADIKVKGDKENEALVVEINSPEDNALLVGYHGQNLMALQTILGLIVAHQQDKWRRILVDVGGYRQERKAKLEEMAQNWAEKAIATGQPVTVHRLNASERRIVHLFLKNKEEVKTFSEGEGKERYLVIAPEKEEK